MSKFVIPKPLYVLLVLMICALSVGYTYAYFSSKHEAVADLQMGKICVVWIDSENGKVINSGDSSIQINAEKLDAGEFSRILTYNKDKSFIQSGLELGNDDATVPMYCRIKIEASYKPQDGETSIKCEELWIQLAYKYGENDPQLISNNGWFYYDGYYYYGADNGDTKTLNKLDPGEIIALANYIYLSPEVDAGIFGGVATIKLIADAVQITNNAYQAVWGVAW